MMVGRDVLFRIEKEKARPGDYVLEVEDLSVLDDRNLHAVDGLSLSVRQGEILGIAGVSGNGQEELAEALAGVRKPIEGNIRLQGEDISDCSPRTIIESGVSQIPSDRKSMGTILDFSIAENVVLPTFYRAPYSHKSLMDWDRVNDYGSQLIEEYDIKIGGPEVPAEWLSGGNLQKLVLARQISLSPRLLVAVQPTRGLDVGATEFVHRKLIEERDRGVAILLISTDLDEVLSISDRIAVIFEGRILGTVDEQDVDLEQIALLMAGVVDQDD
jgi:simple sugar transport system ATP-binding protein